MDAHDPADLLLSDAATSNGTIAERGAGLLEILRCFLPFDAAWLALSDSSGPGYRTVSSIDVDAPVVDFLAGPLMAQDIEVTGTDRDRPPLSPSDLPYPAEELQTWAECLVPAGVYEALAVALFTPTGRHVGFLALLSGDRRPPTAAARRGLGRVAPLLAHGIDPMRSLRTAALLVTGACAGVVLGADGACDELPGLPGHEVLAAGSPALLAARRRIGGRRICGSFLWPVGGPHAPGGHVQVTALAAPEDAPPGLTGLVLVSPPPDLLGLTPRELEVLGLLVEGCSNSEVASTLVIAPRTAAAHLEHVLHKLDAPTRTLAAVRAEQQGLYVPAQQHQRPAIPDPRQGH